MLTAIPGLNHLKVWKPDATEQPAPIIPAPPPLPCSEHIMHRLIFTALEVAAGRKNISNLSKHRYHPAVIRHLQARRKQYRHSGNAAITSMHAHHQGATTLNICGACQLAGKTYAYAAKITIDSQYGEQLCALRIL